MQNKFYQFCFLTTAWYFEGGINYWIAYSCIKQLTRNPDMPSHSKWLLASLLSQMTCQSSLPMTNVFHKTTIYLLALCYPSVFLTFLLKVSVSLFKYFSEGMSTWLNTSWSSSPPLLDPHHGTLRVQSSSGVKKVKVCISYQKSKQSHNQSRAQFDITWSNTEMQRKCIQIPQN